MGEFVVAHILAALEERGQKALVALDHLQCPADSFSLGIGDAGERLASLARLHLPRPQGRLGGQRQTQDADHDAVEMAANVGAGAASPVATVDQQRAQDRQQRGAAHQQPRVAPGRAHGRLPRLGQHIQRDDHDHFTAVRIHHRRQRGHESAVFVGVRSDRLRRTCREHPGHGGRRRFVHGAGRTGERIHGRIVLGAEHVLFAAPADRVQAAVGNDVTVGSELVAQLMVGGRRRVIGGERKAGRQFGIDRARQTRHLAQQIIAHLGIQQARTQIGGGGAERRQSHHAGQQDPPFRFEQRSHETLVGFRMTARGRD